MTINSLLDKIELEIEQEVKTSKGKNNTNAVEHLRSFRKQYGTGYIEMKSKWYD